MLANNICVEGNTNYCILYFKSIEARLSIFTVIWFLNIEWKITGKMVHWFINKERELLRVPIKSFIWSPLFWSIYYGHVNIFRMESVIGKCGWVVNLSICVSSYLSIYLFVYLSFVCDRQVDWKLKFWVDQWQVFQKVQYCLFLWKCWQKYRDS